MCGRVWSLAVVGQRSLLVLWPIAVGYPLHLEWPPQSLQEVSVAWDPARTHEILLALLHFTVCCCHHVSSTLLPPSVTWNNSVIQWGLQIIQDPVSRFTILIKSAKPLFAMNVSSSRFLVTGTWKSLGGHYFAYKNVGRISFGDHLELYILCFGGWVWVGSLNVSLKEIHPNTCVCTHIHTCAHTHTQQPFRVY